MPVRVSIPTQLTISPSTLRFKLLQLLEDAGGNLVLRCSIPLTSTNSSTSSLNYRSWPLVRVGSMKYRHPLAIHASDSVLIGHVSGRFGLD